MVGLDKALTQGFVPGMPTPLVGLPRPSQSYTYRDDAGQIATGQVTIGAKSDIGLRTYLALKAAGRIVKPLALEGCDWV